MYMYACQQLCAALNLKRLTAYCMAVHKISQPNEEKPIEPPPRLSYAGRHFMVLGVNASTYHDIAPWLLN